MTDFSIGQKILIEVVGILLTVVIVLVVLLPVYQATNDYPFWKSNAWQIIAFITLTRWIFFWKFTFFARHQYVKILVTFACIPLAFFLVKALIGFQAYHDEVGFEKHLLALEGKEVIKMISYIRNENIFFGVGAIITVPILFIRSAVSVWLQHNRNRV